MPIENIYVHQHLYRGDAFFHVTGTEHPTRPPPNYIGYVKIPNVPVAYTVQIVESSHYRGYHSVIIDGPPELVGRSVILDIAVFDHSVKTGEHVVPNIWPLTIERKMMFKEKGVLKLCAA